MFAKTVDRFTVTAVSAACFYLFFLNAWHSIPLACGLSFICCAALRRIRSRRPARFAVSAAAAERELMRVIIEEDRAKPESLIREKYSREDFDVECLLKHPSSGLSEGDVFSLWKRHRGKKRLVIAVTGNASPRSIMYAREFTCPAVRVIDRRRLLRMIRETGVHGASAGQTPALSRLSRIRRAFLARRLGFKHGLWGGAMILIYLLAGNPLYLLTGLLILFMLGVSLFNHRERRQLFDT